MAGNSAHRFDPTFTQKCVDAIGPNVPDRTRFIMGKLIQHIHDFAREVELTHEEWMAGVHFINSVGQISTPQRNEAHRMSDVLGLESLVDEIAHHHISESGEAPTSSTILGPFWSPNAPWRAHGDSIILSPHSGEVSLMHGYIRDLDTKKPIANATFDIWEASSNGKYDFQDPDGQVPNNLRGKFKTDANGYYKLYCLKPTAYSLPMDGPSGVIFRLLDRSPWRPAHIHLMISADGYKRVVTQLYPKEDPHLIDDSVFAVKPDLVVDFTPLEGDSKAKLELKYDVYLAPKDSKGEAAARATDGIPASKI